MPCPSQTSGFNVPNYVRNKRSGRQHSLNCAKGKRSRPVCPVVQQEEIESILASSYECIMVHCILRGLFCIDGIDDNEMVFGEMKSGIRQRLPDIRLTVGENLGGKNPTSEEGFGLYIRVGYDILQLSLVDRDGFGLYSRVGLMVGARGTIPSFFANKCKNNHLCGVVRMLVSYAEGPGEERWIR
ncbi:hypothetical protein ANN_25724 [Periplaneta americana]|uniref:Uncharacterized protein n=1 Tax=Periplaneta americana TaxID=6978 RepID=A0ABQ8S4D0_PERAM|nr:hypothetical protein ANN_25724 [Periplaneta americana]